MALYKDLIELDAAVSKARIGRGTPSSQNPYSIESTIGNTVNKVLKQEAAQARRWDQQMVYNQRMAMAEEKRREKLRKAEIDKLPSIKQDKIPQKDKPWLMQEAKGLQAQYLENLKIMDSEDDPFSDAYVQAKTDNDRIMQEYQNINNSYTQLQELSEEYLEDFNQGLISKGNSDLDVHVLDTIFRKKYDESWRENGEIHWRFNGIDGKPMVVKESDLPQWFDKTQKGGTLYMTLWDNFTKQASSGTKYNKDTVNQQIRNIFNQVDNDGMKSLAYDDIAETGTTFIDYYDDQVIKGNKTFVDWRDPENIDILKQELTEYYSGVIKSGMDTRNEEYNDIVASKDWRTKGWRHVQKSGIRQRFVDLLGKPPADWNAATDGKWSEKVEKEIADWFVDNTFSKSRPKVTLKKDGDGNSVIYMYIAGTTDTAGWNITEIVNDEAKFELFVKKYLINKSRVDLLP